MTRGGASARPGTIYHLISRFVAKEWFIESSAERTTYLLLLGSALERTDWRCFSYAVMSSHIHLGLIAGERPLAEWLRPLHTDFAKWINVRRERVGAVFVRGPELVAFEPSGAAALINYIHCNPVRAGLVADPADSDWSSHQAYVGRVCRPPWLDVDAGLELAGFEDGRALAAWMSEVRVQREGLERFRVAPPRRRGRPPHNTDTADRYDGPYDDHDDDREGDRHDDREDVFDVDRDPRAQRHARARALSALWPWFAYA